MSSGQKSSTIAIDFDGVIHEYSQGWQDGSCYDYPMPGAVKALDKLRKKGYNIVVFTARQNLEEVREWFSHHFDVVPYVTNKKPVAIAYIDDRAIRFTNWDDMLKYF